MMDLTLGGPVSLGEYTGPTLDGKPIHSGECNDTEIGCVRCFQTISHMPDELRVKLVNEDGTPYTTYDTDCDWCRTRHDVHQLTWHRAWDEPVYYMLCDACVNKDDAEANSV